MVMFFSSIVWATGISNRCEDGKKGRKACSALPECKWIEENCATDTSDPLKGYPFCYRIKDKLECLKKGGCKWGPAECSHQYLPVK
jgi:hypothetical protein